MEYLLTKLNRDIFHHFEKQEMQLLFVSKKKLCYNYSGISQSNAFLLIEASKGGHWTQASKQASRSKAKVFGTEKS